MWSLQFYFILTFDTFCSFADLHDILLERVEGRFTRDGLSVVELEAEPKGAHLFALKAVELEKVESKGADSLEAVEHAVQWQGEEMVVAARLFRKLHTTWYVMLLASWEWWDRGVA